MIEWWYVRGLHGRGELNEAGRELSSFLFLSKATVCNTWFQNRAIHRQTWQHPKYKKWHFVDYAIVKTALQMCMWMSV